MVKVERTPEFQGWFEKETEKSQRQIEARIANIINHGHYGDAKNLGESLAELRWRSGRRVYFTKTEDAIIILLNGGGKNAQEKDIKKARQIIKSLT